MPGASSDDDSEKRHKNRKIGKVTNNGMMGLAKPEGSDDESDDSSSSSSSEDKKHKKHKHERSKRKREKKDKKEKREKKHKKRKKDKDGDKDKKHKKHKREHESVAKAGACNTWGKYGIIKDSDMYEKQEEFLAWLTEVKGIAQESCGRRELETHFSDYVEDYNTATLAGGEKYYNLRVWYVKEERRKAAQGADAARAEAETYERSSFDDERDRKAEIKREQDKRSNATAMIMAKAMHGGSHLVEDMQEQEQKRRSMQAAYKTGNAEKAREIALALDPSKVSEAELRATWGSGGGPSKKARKPQKQ